MADSEIDICNGGLVLLGEEPIVNFDDGINGKRCKYLWSKSRDAVLRMHPWNCAVERIQLAPDSTAPLFGYTAAFTLPAKTLRILEVSGVTDYKIERRKILADESSLSIRHIFRNTAVPEYDALLVQLLEHYMAWKLAYPVTRSNAVRKEMWEYFTAILPKGTNIDAQEEPQDRIGGTSSLISARY